MGPVVEWARRWLGVSQLEAENRLLRADLRRVEVVLEQLQANIAAAERVAAYGGSDALSRVVAVLRRGR